jgi:hypothetical protein
MHPARLSNLDRFSRILCLGLITLANKLLAQLEGQILGGKNRFSVLMVQWPAFDDLDVDSQGMFMGVIESVREFGEEHGVSVKFRS